MRYLTVKRAVNTSSTLSHHTNNHPSFTMTREDLNIAETYKQITEAEKQALALESMLDALDSKMDSILAEIEQNQLDAARERENGKQVGKVPENDEQS